MQKRANGAVPCGLRRRWVLGAAASWAVAGCQTMKVNADEWAPANMQGEPVKVAAGETSRRTRVVVLPSEENPGSPPGARLGARATAAIAQALGGGGVELVDRSLAERLDKELKLAEMGGTGSYGGPDVADYVIRVKLGSARAESTYVQPQSSVDKKTGKTTTTPGGWTNAGTSSMTIEIRSVPGLKLLQAIQTTGNTRETQQPTKGNDVALVQKATDQGIEVKRSEVLNLFSPKGYVLERRTKKDQSIFRVQLGKETGVNPGDTLEIWRTNSFGDEVSVGQGEMTTVGMAGSWLLVKSEKVAAQVKHGDYVKVKHGGFMDSIRNLSNSLGL